MDSELVTALRISGVAKPRTAEDGSKANGRAVFAQCFPEAS